MFTTNSACETTSHRVPTQEVEFKDMLPRGGSRALVVSARDGRDINRFSVAIARYGLSEQVSKYNDDDLGLEGEGRGRGISAIPKMMVGVYGMRVVGLAIQKNKNAGDFRGHKRSIFSPLHALARNINDLEAGVAHEEFDSDSSDENEDEDGFIAEGDVSDSTSDSPNFSDLCSPALDGDEWDSLLERAKTRANFSERPLDGDEGYNLGLLDAPPELWVLSCFGVKAAFIMPLMEKQVWLEADMSASLKNWLVDIPGVVHRNQQVVLHAVSPHESRRVLSSTLTPPFVPGSWVKVRRGNLQGDVGMGSTYEHDLLVSRIVFSLIEIARKIPDNLATLFAQSRHPQVRKNIYSVPRISEWCFHEGEMITDTSKGQSGTIRSIGEHAVEAEFTDGLFPVTWANCRKEFNIGQYVEISEGESGDRWSGWIHAIENGMLHLISPPGRTNYAIEARGVHPNAVVAIPAPDGLYDSPAQATQSLASTPSAPWKGVMVLITKKRHHWRGKKGYVIDVNPTIDLDTQKAGLAVLVELAVYDPNIPFGRLWFPYLDVVEEESWLPLNEARPLEVGQEFFHNLVPETNVLQSKGRRIPTIVLSQQPEEPGNATPLPDPSERCLSPAWNPSSPDPPLHWCLDSRLLGARFRVQYNGRQIVALTKRNSRRDIICVRNDTSLEEDLDPARVLAIHPKIRHYDMFLVISGEHCGKWVRSIQFSKRSSSDNTDIDWTVAVVIPRAPYLPDNVTDERLILHNSRMTVAEETRESKALNSTLRRQLRQPSRDY
ncbi:uncharacterized protein EV420DRAFT_1485886 [Desarmillaria tabescens]|uniref:Chromatin elongation factor spt5 n=1 Tax=Armillaria tabescens TaxID=1929756 RepID=A0AA39JDL6_ARMTA|nr:uncharacterized protein EV420DRAFT_1485886 [Desarmillaria tabescens]KAK0440678.1 hypothetical protein EV420DRAFT_1485886 [Desarmillaria tabescens]